MGKEGPCYHCGITTTPLWRNGPPDKPVLCNACGSRWRTKGTLHNYMPMHSGGFGVGPENARWPMKHLNRSPVHSDKTLSRKRKESPSESAFSKTSNTYVSSTSVDEDASTMNSEISTFDGPLSSAVHSASAVPVRGTPWDSPVPSRRRTNMFRSRASSERIARNLVSVEEQEVSSVTCPSSDVLVETRSPLVAVEIGLGSVFIRPPAHLVVHEPDSEATSLLIDNSSRAYEHAEVFSNTESRRISGLYSSRLAASAVPSRGKEKLRPALKRLEAGRSYSNKALLECFPYNKRDVLQSVQSPLIFLELKDIVNHDTFTGLLTDQEQLQLMKHLSSVDVSQCPESLRSMFSSSQFEEALANFQCLLSEGMFDSSAAGFNPRLVQHYQQLLSVTDLTASGWTESLSQLHTRNKRRPEPAAKDKSKIPEIEGASPLQPAERKADSLPKVHQTLDGYTPAAAYNAGISSAASDSSLKAKKPVNLMEEGHDSGGEQEEDLLVDVPSFHKADSLLLHHGNSGIRPSSGWTMTNVLESSSRGNNTANTAEVGDLIVTNTWQTADWDVGLIGAGRRRDLVNDSF